jgi:mannosyltransferase OCH1-like enzyme
MLEQACVASFVRCGFNVRVYSYHHLALPPGATLHDAREILPEVDLKKYTQSGRSEDLPAFSDAFRYSLLARKGGWWFDTDVVCLARADRFAELVHAKTPRIGLGYEDSTSINGAVLYVDDARLTESIAEELNRRGTVFTWGTIGPALLTSVIEQARASHAVEASNTFYPVHWNDFRKLMDPEFASWCEDRTRDSLTVHLWSEIARMFNVPRDILPPRGSYLHELFLGLCPQWRDLPSLPADWVRNLPDLRDVQPS